MNIEAINEHSGHKTIVYHILSVRVIVGPNPVECETNLTHFCHPKTMKSLRNRDKMKDDAIAQLSAKMQQFEKRQARIN